MNCLQNGTKKMLKMKVNQNNPQNPRPQTNISLIKDSYYMTQREFLTKYPNKTQEDYQRLRKQVVGMNKSLFKNKK